MHRQSLLMALALAPALPAQQQPIVGGESPAVSPDGRRIAFLSDRTGTAQLYVIGVDGTGEFMVTATPGPKGPPAWIDGGRRLRYSTFAHDTTRLFTVEAGGGTPRLVGMVPGRMVSVAPDGARLVYSVGTWTANRLFTARLDGRDPVAITDSASIAWNMQWSPDGKRIAYTGRPGPGRDLAVMVMNADGSDRRQVTSIAPERGNAQMPAWSRDGRRLAVQVSDTGHSGGIWLVDFPGGSARELAPHGRGFDDEVPTWFPDGKRIAFQSDRTGRIEVWIMNVDGSGIRQVTGLAGPGGPP